jgi:hypothetical protein
MALGTYFTPASFTPQQYDELTRRLDAAGAGTPPGRLHHIALETGGHIQVLDIWDTAASFHAFGSALVPALAALGIDPGEPQVSSVYALTSDGEDAAVDAGQTDDRPTRVHLVRQAAQR